MGDYEADAPRASGSKQPNRGPDIERLLALLEAAVEGSRELDAQIGALVGLVDFHCDEGTWFYGLDLNDDHGPWEECPAYTTALDAALTLVPEGLFWYVQSADSYRSFDGKCSAAAFVNGRGFADSGPNWHATGNTPALALCIAALKARVQIRALAPPDARASGASPQESKDFPP